MSYHLITDWRNKHNHQQGKTPQIYNPMYHSIASYCTETKTEKMDTKSDLDEILHQSNYISHLHMLPNPLQKNLADALLEKTTKTPSRVYHQENRDRPANNSAKSKEMTPETYNTAFGSIGSFISGVFSVISSAMPFQRRPKSPERDNFERAHDGSPPLDFWLPANLAIQNKNNCRDQLNIQSCSNTSYDSAGDEMSSDCRSAAVNCEDKLNKVRMLLVSQPVSKPQAVVRPRRPKKVFVGPNSVEEGFADTFTPEDLVTLSNDHVVECVSPCNHVTEGLVQIEGATMKTGFAQFGSTEALKPIDVPVKELSNDVTLDMGVDEVGPKNGLSAPKKVIIPAKVANVSTPTKDLTAETTVQDENCTKIIESTKTALETVPKLLTDTKTPSQSQEMMPKDTIPVTQAIEDPKTVIIQSCEDKVSRLKALLQERRKNNSKIIQHSSDSAQEAVEENPEHRFKSNKPIDINKTQNKHFKNPNRQSTERRSKSNMRKDIQDDMSFANEVDLESSSVENSPKTVHLPKPKCVKKRETKSKVDMPVKVITESPQTDKTCYFNEISGRFRNSSTTESEDSFQIVFTDSPQLSPRTRRLSDCDSEDSFIIFEDVPGSCYTSADVFGHTESETDYSDYDTDDSDHNTSCKLSHNLSRTVSDLTDDSLYEDNAVQQPRPYSDSDDEVDSSVKMAQQVNSSEIVKEDEIVNTNGLLLNAAKKLARKGQPPKKVRFSSSPPKVRVMRVWAFAARQARAGHWEQHAVDRERFKRKIADVDMAVSWVLKPQHRNRVKFQRFMPWWHSERRRELAEKKEREAAEEKRRLEEEARRLEEERIRLEEERVAEEERLRVEEERRLAAVEEEKRRVEKERLKAEEKRLTEIKRQMILQNHMKSEAQRAAEVSRRRSENERKRKEEERFRLEAKLIAEELRKKMEEDKRKIEDEITRLSAEKLMLEQGKAAGVVDDGGMEEKDTVHIQDTAAPSAENRVEIKNANVNVERTAEEDGNNAEVEKVTENEMSKEENAANKKQPMMITGSVTEKENRADKCNVPDLNVEYEKKLASGDLKSGEGFASASDNIDVIHICSDDKIVSDNTVEIKMNAIEVDKKAESEIFEINANYSKANSITEDDKINDVKVCCVKQESNLTDMGEMLLNCVDKVILVDDNRSVAECFGNNNIVEQENIIKNCSGISGTEQSAANNYLVYERTGEHNLKVDSETSKIENSKVANVSKTTKVKTVNENVKSNNLKAVTPTMKKIQLTQNSFSPANVKNNRNIINSENVDRNMNNINLHDRVSPVAVIDSSNVAKQN